MLWIDPHADAVEPMISPDTGNDDERQGPAGDREPPLQEERQRDDRQANEPRTDRDPDRRDVRGGLARRHEPDPEDQRTGHRVDDGPAGARGVVGE